MTLADELSKLSALRTAGGLTEAEFTRAKERLLQAEQPADPLADSPRTPDSLASTINAFRRSRTQRWFGGVCGGMARSTGMEPWVWRLLFALMFLFAGAGLLIYCLLWIFVPND